MPQVQQLFGTPGGVTGTSLPSITGEPNSATKSTPRDAYVKSTYASPRKPSSTSKASTASPRRHIAGQPITSEQALSLHRRVLTPYEREEIRQYSKVWFVGEAAHKINAGEGKGKNFGYDDEKGRYKCVKHDHIGYRYEVVKGLGKGSFGDVVKAYDHKTRKSYALKIIRNEKRFHKQAKSEIKLLDLLRNEDGADSNNVIHMHDYFIFRGHICVTFEMLHCDLYAALKDNNFKGYNVNDVASITGSLVTALQMLARLRIIHCDLKPENILLRSQKGLGVKVIDFGSSCFDTERVHSYIQSRFYRSPEVILGGSYGVPIDMWSLGCIMAELHTGQPLFPGHNEREQLMYQMEMLGKPPAKLLAECKRTKSFFSQAGDTIEPLHITDSKGRTRMPSTKSFVASLGKAGKNRDFVDFVARCVIFDPAARMTPDEAAQHPLLAGPEQRAAAALATDLAAARFFAAGKATPGKATPGSTTKPGSAVKKGMRSKLFGR